MTQTIYRPARRERFTIVTNRIMNDRRLSAEALGVLVFLLSLPDDWSIHSGQLQERFDVGREKMQSVMRELREAGYARLERIGGGSGQFAGTRWVIEEEPDGEHREPEKPSLGDSAERRVSRQSAKPTAGKPGSELLKTKIIQKTNSEQNTVSPQPPEGEREAEDLSSGHSEASSPVDVTEAWRRFSSAWPFDAVDYRRAAAQAEFEKLTDGEREEAIRCAPRFADAWRARGRSGLPDARSWIKAKGWEACDRNDRLGCGAPAQKTAAERLTDGQYRLHPNSEQLQRWRDHERRTLGKARLGLARPSEWPPSVSTRIDAGEVTPGDDDGSLTVPMPEKHFGAADRMGSFPFALAEGQR